MKTTSFESEQRRYDNMQPESKPTDVEVHIKKAVDAIESAFSDLKDDVDFYDLNKKELTEFFDAVKKKIKELEKGV